MSQLYKMHIYLKGFWRSKLQSILIRLSHLNGYSRFNGSSRHVLNAKLALMVQFVNLHNLA